MEIRIGKTRIAQGGRPYIIAEIGQAHGGSLLVALHLMAAAKRVGADAVKFQYHLADEESSQRYDYWKSVEFTQSQWMAMRAEAARLEIDFIVTPFSLKAVDLAAQLLPHAWKIPSSPIWWKRLNACPKAIPDLPVIVSTGMSTCDEIDQVASLAHPLALMQCTSLYPTPLDKVGLNMIEVMHKRYKVPVGLSDHSGTVYPAVAAMCMGAPLIEVHIKSVENDTFPDMGSSLMIHDLSAICTMRDALELMRTKVDKDQMAAELKHQRVKYGRPEKVGQAMKQDDLFDAFQSGVMKAELCADKAGEEWKDAAFQAFVEYAKRGVLFTTEDVREANPQIVAHDDRAWGFIARRAARAGVIKSAGQRRVKSSHGMFKTLWAAA